ncbi:hypothetical protein M404DRAFT_558728 [Pisolithus tinctorius Marx 270]|uniref:Uncharacterized protein n=1 Tax=Pisolithus tinctorius Marx 270 TaxID=870435 RepID=A0A0C3J5S5_PISTI|nr:hypothetical protein M404DRAFT_558728 [Pisolithus tinctorius Marx 270]
MAHVVPIVSTTDHIYIYGPSCKQESVIKKRRYVNGPNSSRLPREERGRIRKNYSNPKSGKEPIHMLRLSIERWGDVGTGSLPMAGNAA